jgi:hypothetical protein
VPISVFAVFAAAARDLLRPRIIGLILWPLFGAALFWLTLVWACWSSLVRSFDWLRDRLLHGDSWAQWINPTAAHWIEGSLLLILLLLVLPYLVLFTALFITSQIGMPVLVREVSAREHAALQRRQGGTFIGGLFNGVAATFAYLSAWVLTLPLLLFSPLGLIVPVVLNAAVNLWLFRYDALAEHASRDEFRRLARTARGGWWTLAFVTAVVELVPFANLITPVFAGLCFVHFGLRSLERLRKEGS